MIELVFFQIQAPNGQWDDPDQSKHTFVFDISQGAAA